MKCEVSIAGGNFGKIAIETDFLNVAEKPAWEWILKGYWPERNKRKSSRSTSRTKTAINGHLAQVVHGNVEPNCADEYVHDWKSDEPRAVKQTREKAL